MTETGNQAPINRVYEPNLPSIESLFNCLYFNTHYIYQKWFIQLKTFWLSFFLETKYSYANQAIVSETLSLKFEVLAFFLT